MIPGERALALNLLHRLVEEGTGKMTTNQTMAGEPLSLWPVRRRTSRANRKRTMVGAHRPLRPWSGTSPRLLDPADRRRMPVDGVVPRQPPRSQPLRMSRSLRPGLLKINLMSGEETRVDGSLCVYRGRKIGNTYNKSWTLLKNGKKTNGIHVHDEWRLLVYK